MKYRPFSCPFLAQWISNSQQYYLHCVPPHFSANCPFNRVSDCFWLFGIRDLSLLQSEGITRANKFQFRFSDGSTFHFGVSNDRNGSLISRLARELDLMTRDLSSDSKDELNLSSGLVFVFCFLCCYCCCHCYYCCYCCYCCGLMTWFSWFFSLCLSLSLFLFLSVFIVFSNYLTMIDCSVQFCGAPKMPRVCFVHLPRCRQGRRRRRKFTPLHFLFL